MSSDDSSDKECPLCMEPFDSDDLNFYPCECQYQICRFCWHRLRTDENGLCPACRQPYSEDPANFQPPSNAQLKKAKAKSKEKNKTAGKTDPIDLRQQLSHYRVLQKNLVYVIGLSQKLADADLLQKPEFFGRFGKIFKVAVGTIAGTTGQQTSWTAYITYHQEDDALRAIEGMNNVRFGDCVLKASLGTSKYCAMFLRGQPCYKAINGKTECMYLHKIGDPEASFTIEDMYAGKHLEYERKLHEELANRAQEISQPNEVVESKLASTMGRCTIKTDSSSDSANDQVLVKELSKSSLLPPAAQKQSPEHAIVQEDKSLPEVLKYKTTPSANSANARAPLIIKFLADSDDDMEEYECEETEIGSTRQFELELLSSLTNKPIHKLMESEDPDLLDKIYAFSDNLSHRNLVIDYESEEMIEFDRKHARDLPSHVRIQPIPNFEERKNWYLSTSSDNESSMWPS